MSGKHASACWAAEVSPCDGKISGEHYITRGLWQSQYVVVTGLRSSESQTLSIDNLVTNSLCEHHNSALSPVDQCGIDLVNALRRTEELREIRKRLRTAKTVVGCPRIAFRVDMLGVERWALKTMLSCARVFRSRLGDWQPPIKVSRVVFGQESLPNGVGLGMLANVGDDVNDGERIQVRFGQRPSDTGPTAFAITLRGGWKFMVSWDAALKDFTGFNIADEIYTGADHTIWHPNRINIEQPGVRINVRIDFDWSGTGSNEEVIQLRKRYRPPPR